MAKKDKETTEQDQVDKVVSEQVTASAEKASEVPGPGQFPVEAERDEQGQPVAEATRDVPPTVEN